MTSGAWTAVGAVALALAFGLWPLATDGRVRGTHLVRRSDTRPVEDGRGPVTGPAATVVAAVGETLGDRATLLQFSSAFCAPCRATRRVLADVAGLVEGVAHVEVEAEHHLEATRALGILRTPTTVVLDGSGAEVTRATGAPTRDQVLSALAQT